MLWLSRRSVQSRRRQVNLQQMLWYLLTVGLTPQVLSGKLYTVRYQSIIQDLGIVQQVAITTLYVSSMSSMACRMPMSCQLAMSTHYPMFSLPSMSSMLVATQAARDENAKKFPDTGYVCNYFRDSLKSLKLPAKGNSAHKEGRGQKVYSPFLNKYGNVDLPTVGFLLEAGGLPKIIMNFLLLAMQNF